MATSVLGKRTRNSTDQGVDSPARQPKRQVPTKIFSDENENPFVVRRSRTKNGKFNSTELDELANECNVQSSSPKRTRGILIPTKIKTHFNTDKSGIDENSKPFLVKTPQTPRHRDALSKHIPVTPRHRVLISYNAITPRTPRTPSTPSLPTIYNVARQLFTRSADPGRLIGRDEERRELTQFISTCVESNSGGCIYVSGPPGTGKSALVSEVAGSQEHPNLKKAYINCMSMKCPKDVYGTLLEAFCEGRELLEGDEIQILQGIFGHRKRATTIYMVTLDEIDHVLTLDLEVLYKLFEWSLQKSSKLILVGIANALDLTDRFLPRLKARNLKPQLIPFLPYNATQIKGIITTKLRSVVGADSTTPDYVPFLHPAAIELCSRKVSSQTGDLRKAFDICRRAIDLIENETKRKHQEALDQTQSSPSRKPLGENANLSSPSIPSLNMPSQQKALNNSLAAMTVLTAPRATIAHLNKITSAVFGNGANQRLKALNIQQKAALCALVALEKKKRTAATNIMATPSKSTDAAPTIKALYDTYCMLCRREAVLHPLTSTEFRDVIGSLETLSLINAVDGKNGSFVAFTTPSKRGRKPGFGGGVGTGDEKRVRSCVGEREVLQAVEGVGAAILTSILSGEGLD